MARQAAQRVFSLIEEPSMIDPHSDDQKDAISIDEKTFRGEIEFKDVWFRYPTQQITSDSSAGDSINWALKGFNLTIKAQESVAIVGVNGCGKSTLLSLALRFYDPDLGQVLVDGVDVKKYKIAELRQCVGLAL